MRAFLSDASERLTNPWYVNVYGRESGCNAQTERAEAEARAILAETERGPVTIYHGSAALYACGEPTWEADGREARRAATALSEALAAFVADGEAR
jgi:hypothetical protein